jgi:hypothetical protein
MNVDVDLLKSEVQALYSLAWYCPLLCHCMIKVKLEELGHLLRLLYDLIFSYFIIIQMLILVVPRHHLCQMIIRHYLLSL